MIEITEYHTGKEKISMYLKLKGDNELDLLREILKKMHKVDKINFVYKTI